MRDRAQVIKELTPGTFSDGNINIENAAAPSIDPDAKFLIEKCMNENWELIEENRDLYGRTTGAYYGR